MVVLHQTQRVQEGLGVQVRGKPPTQTTPALIWAKYPTLVESYPSEEAGPSLARPWACPSLAPPLQPQ